MNSRRHLLAVNRMIADAHLAGRPEHGPLVQVGRDLARQMDSLSPGEATAALLTEYRRALAELRRAASEASEKDAKRGSATGSKLADSDLVPAALVEVESFEQIPGLDGMSDLDRHRLVWGAKPGDQYWEVLAAERAGLAGEIHARMWDDAAESAGVEPVCICYGDSTLAHVGCSRVGGCGERPSRELVRRRYADRHQGP